MIQRDHDGVRWELQPDFAPLLDEVLKAPGDLIKESPVKQVTLHRAGGNGFFVKRYLHAAVPLRPLKFFFKSTQAQQEWELARQLEERGIPIVRHVALGERRTWTGVHESILITEGFDGVPLNEAPDVDPAIVLKFVEQMHERGVLQMDLHPANLLLRREPFELRLVDLHGAIVKPHLGRNERRQNLAILRSYLAIDVEPEIQRLSVVLRREHLYQRSRRCLRHNRDFAPLDVGGLKWQVRPALLNTAVHRILAAPDEFLARPAKLMKGGRSATVAGGDGFVLKRYNLRRVSRLFKDLFRSSPAFDCFRKAYHLELAGIRTARPVATTERRVLRFLIRSYFLMEEIPGAVSLEDRMKSGSISPEVIGSTAKLIGRLHGEGLSHRDLKTSNIIFDAEGRPYLIDLDGLAYCGEVPKARARADLERMVRSVEQWIRIDRRQRWRFLRWYWRGRRSSAGIRREPDGAPVDAGS